MRLALIVSVWLQSSFFTEIREVVRAEDLDAFDRLVFDSGGRGGEEEPEWRGNAARGAAPYGGEYAYRRDEQEPTWTPWERVSWGRRSQWQVRRQKGERLMRSAR